MPHPVIRDGTPKHQDSVTGIYEEMGIPCVRVHRHTSKFLRLNLCTEFDRVALKIGCVDLALVDLNHRPVLHVAVRANSEVDLRGEDNMA